jgi:hypothetical protein
MMPSSTTRPTTRQTGYALILMVVALMGLGGAVVIGFTQQAKKDVEVQRYQHNQRVLKQAKQALLMFAYNYPQTNPGIGPGRLPCPDQDNNGAIEFPPVCNLVGRFPWADDRLGIQETLDASGERLWYAVSAAFRNHNTAGDINYDTSGTITLVDQSGGIIYDGDGAGIAAVIIAPGTILKRDDDANGTYEYTQLRNTDPQKTDPRNYLDTFDGFDNSVFTNGQSDTNDDGFIMGPVYDINKSTIVVNDQLIIVTADEVIAMAEKAVLAAYRDAIDAYLAPAADGGTDGVYPWLYNYVGVADEPALSSYFPANASFATELATNLGNVGRIPSIFANYFTEAKSQKIDSRLVGSLEVDFSSLLVNSSANGLMQFADGVVTIPITTTDVLTNVGFDDLVDTVGADGGFTATMPIPQTFSTSWVYFWDDDDFPTNVWRICQNGAANISDCWRTSGGATGHGSNDNKEYILRVMIQFTLEDTLNIDVNYDDNAPTINPPTAGSNVEHAIIGGTYELDNLLVSSTDFAAKITVIYEFDEHYHTGGTENFEIDPVGNLGSLTSSDLLPGAKLTLGMRYFPELPGWALPYDFDDSPKGNDWHNSILMAYAASYRPGTPVPCSPGTDCLTIANTGSPLNDKASLLLIAGPHVWVGVDPESVFDTGNGDLDGDFDARAVGGNDHLLVIEEI